MGIEAPIVNGHLLDLISVKNTFIHLVCNEDGAPKKEGLVRCRTDPTPGPVGRCLRRTDTNNFNFLDGDNTSDSEKDNSEAQPFDDDTTVEEDGEVEAEHDKEHDDQDETQANALGQRASWTVCGRRLRGKDTRLSHSFSLSVAPGFAEQEFVVTLHPLVTSKRRGCGSFGATKGLGVIHVKCCSKADDAELSVAVVVGGEQSERRVHNFARESVCKFETEWRFGDFVETEAESVDIALEVSLKNLPLTTSPTCDFEQDLLATDGESDEEAQSWSCGAAIDPSLGVDSSCLSIGAATDVNYVYVYCEPQPQPQMWCGDSQPPHEVRDGDWYCPKCGDFQFGRNSACRMCGGPKPERTEQWSTTGQPQMFAAVFFPLDGSGNADYSSMACVMPIGGDIGTPQQQASFDTIADSPQKVLDGDSDALTEAKTDTEKRKPRPRRRRRAGKGPAKMTDAWYWNDWKESEW